MHSTRSPTGPFALFLASTIAALLAGSPARAVSGGAATDDASYGFVARLEIGDPENGGRVCSGALIEPRWVITAKSCFAEDGRPLVAGAPDLPTVVTVGRPDRGEATGHVLPAIQLVPHSEHDLVLVKLLAAVPESIRPVPLGSEVPVAGGRLVAAGFGRTATEWLPDQLHAASFSVDGITDSALTMQAENGASTCRGDAGGPVLLEAEGRSSLVAIHRSSWQGGCLGEAEARHGAIGTRVDALRDWIAAALGEHSSRTIVRNNHTQGCLGVLKGATNDGAHAVQWICSDADDHSWALRAREEGYFDIVNHHSGKCLGIGAAAEKGAQVVQLACGAPSQQWSGQLNGEGLVQFRNRQSGQCLGILRASPDRGAPAVQWPCGFKGDHLWQVRERNLARSLRNALTQRCLGIFKAATNEGAAAIQWSCGGNVDHFWQVRRPVAAPQPGNDWAQIFNISSNMCLSVGESREPGTPVRQSRCGGEAGQLWTVDQVQENGKSLLRYRNVLSDQCLGIAKGNPEPGAAAVQWPCGAQDHNWLP